MSNNINQNMTQQNVFCKNCDNFMDITNNISIAENNINLQGGYVSSDEEADELFEIDESSDYDVSITDDMSVSMSMNTNTNMNMNKIGGNSKKDDKNKKKELKQSLSNDDLNNILEGSDIEYDLKNFNINELSKNSVFNKLSGNHKTLVINRILERIPKNKQQKHTEHVSGKESYFYCKSCGYNEKIPERQFIFSRGNEKKDDLYNYRFINYIHEPLNPKTKNYNCINDKCATHANPSLKMAVFYRQKDSYNIRYICTVCNNYWNTFSEK